MRPWQLTHNGKTWRDMPGETNDLKKLNFYLFRHGKYNPDGWRDIFAGRDSDPAVAKAVKEGRRAAKMDEIAMELEAE